MFFSDPVAAFANIGRALRPGGQRRPDDLAATGEERVARRAPGARWRWAGRCQSRRWACPVRSGWPIPNKLAGSSTNTGYLDIEFATIREPFYAGTNTGDAFSFVRGIPVVQGLLEDLDEATTARALEQLRTTLAAHETSDGVRFDSRAWLISAHT